MNTNIYKMTIILLVAGANILLFQNCSKKMKFSTATDGSNALNGGGDGTYNPGEGDGSTGGTGSNGALPPACTETFEEIQLPVKVLFIVDVSGSNADNTYTALADDGTDVNKSWRSNILNQLRSANNSSFFKYNYVLFRGNDDNANDCNRFGPCGGTTTTTDVLMSGFTNDPSVIDVAISAFQNTADKGKTPYKGALLKAKELIKADIDANPNDKTTRYSVIMVTDGHPDYNLVTKPGGDPNLGSDADIPGSIGVADSLVSGIVSLDSERVNLNTIYYYKPDQYSSTAVTILSSMADAGNGAFLKADTGNATLDLKHTVTVPKTTCPN